MLVYQRVTRSDQKSQAPSEHGSAMMLKLPGELHPKLTSWTPTWPFPRVSWRLPTRQCFGSKGGDSEWMVEKAENGMSKCPKLCENGDKSKDTPSNTSRSRSNLTAFIGIIGRSKQQKLCNSDDKSKEVKLNTGSRKSKCPMFRNDTVKPRKTTSRTDGLQPSCAPEMDGMDPKQPMACENGGKSILATSQINGLSSGRARLRAKGGDPSRVQPSTGRTSTGPRWTKPRAEMDGPSWAQLLGKGEKSKCWRPNTSSNSSSCAKEWANISSSKWEESKIDSERSKTTLPSTEGLKSDWLKLWMKINTSRWPMSKTSSARSSRASPCSEAMASNAAWPRTNSNTSILALPKAKNDSSGCAKVLKGNEKPGKMELKTISKTPKWPRLCGSNEKSSAAEPKIDMEKSSWRVRHNNRSKSKQLEVLIDNMKFKLERSSTNSFSSR